ncbi:hypothetical protein ABEB36_009129 [Hypothenemus hampei]|uniref:Wolframin n=1 Tax=Hypothenemus hampei TaxID=57062 RepID=A0ABD1ERE7_HYPHA
MAGVIPKKQTSGRKQWTIHGPQRSSLNRLRSQLASDGCPASQVVLAKQLLEEECEYKSEQRENARLGVYWLLKASEQGNLEATDLLKSCLETGKGISEHNYMDVKACLSMTQDEKIVRRAAKEVFASLSNGEDYITSLQLQNRILAIDRDEINPVKLFETDSEDDEGEVLNNYLDIANKDWSQRSDLNNEKLTEDSLVSAAIMFSRGYLPAINHFLCLSEPNLRALDDVPFFYRSILHPLFSLKIIYFKLMKYFGNWSIPLPLAKSEMHLITLFLIYSISSFKDFTLFLPTVLFYLSFLVMIITTFQLLQTQRELHDFRLWRGLFICYSNGDLNEYGFETQFIINHTKQYAWFFFSLLLHYFTYSVTPIKFESELTVISCCLMFMTLFGFMPKRRSKTIIDPLVLLSFAINVLARYPYDTDPIVSRGWRYLELNFPSFPNYVVGNGIEFCINFRLVLYVSIPLILFQMAKKGKWRGSYKTVLPHLVTLSWLQYFALCSHNTTMYGLFRATLALVGSVLFLPLVGLMSVILPVAAITRWIVTSHVIYTIGLFLFLLAICLTVCFICARTRYAQYTAVVQVILMLVAFLALIKTSEHTTSISNGYVMSLRSKDLDWDTFQKLCYQKVWEESENMASAQIRCSDLEHTHIFWEGTVTSVSLVSVKNNVKEFVDKFPKFIASYLYCLLGQQQQPCDQQDNPSQLTDCLILQQTALNKCNLYNFNVYTFEMALKMPSLFWRFHPEIRLILSNEFRNFTTRIKQNDLLWFKGSLFNHKDQGILGSLITHVNAVEVGCISCNDRTLSTAKISDDGIFGVNFVRTFYNSCKFVLNVFFSPVLIFK